MNAKKNIKKIAQFNFLFRLNVVCVVIDVDGPEESKTLNLFANRVDGVGLVESKITGRRNRKVGKHW